MLHCLAVQLRPLVVRRLTVGKVVPANSWQKKLWRRRPGRPLAVRVPPVQIRLASSWPRDCIWGKRGTRRWRRRSWGEQVVTTNWKLFPELGEKCKTVAMENIVNFFAHPLELWIGGKSGAGNGAEAKVGEPRRPTDCCPSRCCGSKSIGLLQSVALF